MKKVLLDNGHGVATAGKRSPDERLIEGRYAREIVRRLAQELESAGIPYAMITPENDDTPLRTRVYRANQLHRANRDGSILLSIHSDAAGNGGWYNARGMSVRIAPNASQSTKVLSRCLYKSFEDAKIPVRKYYGDTTPWWSQNLAICRDTIMPAVLVEMFFHTNKEQVDWALSAEGKSALVNALLDAIRNYLHA